MDTHLHGAIWSRTDFYGHVAVTIGDQSRVQNELPGQLGESFMKS